MFLHTHVWVPFLLAAGVVAASSPGTRAAEEPWEKLPNGVLGQVAMFAGADGVKIAGYVRKPAGAGPFPIVIILHGGGPTARAVSGKTEEERAKAMADETLRASNQLGHATNPPLADFLAQGWAIYSIDYRTNPRYILDPLEWDDTLVAVNKARSFSFVDPKRMAMVGGSHGGHVTGRMISRVDLCCAVLFAPAGLDLIALSHLADQGTPIGGNQGLVRAFEQRAGVKMAEIEKNPEAYHYSSPLTEIAKVRCPILLISGKNDPNAPLPVMDQYVDALRARGKEAETYHPDNGPHGFYWGFPKVIPETAVSTQRTVAFIKKHFDKATAPPSPGARAPQNGPAKIAAVAENLVPLTEPGIRPLEGSQDEQLPDGSIGRVSEFRGCDGTTWIPAYVRKPKGNGPFPLVVRLHGGGQSKEGTYGYGRNLPLTADFLAAGWAVVSIDYRVTTVTRANLGKAVIVFPPHPPIETNDTLAAIEAARRLPFVDGQRVAVMGGSHGGYVMSKVASRADLRGAIICAPAILDAIELGKALEQGVPMIQVIKNKIAEAEQKYGAPLAVIAENPEIYGYESPITEAPKVRCPILIINGRNDLASPIQAVQTYADKLRSLGKEAETYFPDNGPHDFENWVGPKHIPETDEAAKRVVAFITKHFAADSR